METERQLYDVTHQYMIVNATHSLAWKKRQRETETERKIQPERGRDRDRETERIVYYPHPV